MPVGQPATRERGSKKKSYRKTYPNLFIDEYVCAVKCHECMTNGGGGLYKKLIAKANLQDTAAQSTISCKCKKAFVTVDKTGVTTVFSARMAKRAK